MTAPIRTSTVIEALLAINTRLEALVFTANSETGETPKLAFLGFYTDLSREFVHLVGKVPDDELEHAGAGPAARQETYVVQITCGTVVKGIEGPAAMARLKEISDVVEVAFRDQTTGIPIPPDLGGAEVVKGGIERFEVAGFTSDVGAAATADIFIRIFARI